MDSISSSSKCDLDSVASTDSLHLITDEFRLRHICTPDVTNGELSRRAVSLELENERLRVELETSRVELNAKIASNQGLKDKITEMYLEAQSALQERLKLENALKNARAQVIVADDSRKLYQMQIYELQASKKGLQMEIDTYRHLARQKQELATALTARCKQSNVEYIELTERFRRERQELKEVIEELRTNCIPRFLTSDSLGTSQARLSPDLSTKLETTEDELRDMKIELKTLEQDLLSAQVAKTSMESTLVKHRELISDMEIDMGKCEMEKQDVENRLNTVQIELNKMKLEKEFLQSTLLTSRQEQEQVEQAIVQLKCQLNKMITQYKLIKSRNAELESEIATLQEVKNENKNLKSRSIAANSSLFKKLRESKRKIKLLEEQLKKDSRKQLLQAAQCTVLVLILFSVYSSQKYKRNYKILPTQSFAFQRIQTDGSLQDCLKRALERNKELKERLKLVSLTNTFEESIDEGYGDGYAQSLVMDLPSPTPLHPRLMQCISEVLANSRNFLNPVHIGLEELREKLETFRVGQTLAFHPLNRARSVV